MQTPWIHEQGQDVFYFSFLDGCISKAPITKIISSSVNPTLKSSAKGSTQQLDMKFTSKSIYFATHLIKLEGLGEMTVTLTPALGGQQMLNSIPEKQPLPSFWSTGLGVIMEGPEDKAKVQDEH